MGKDKQLRDAAAAAAAPPRGLVYVGAEAVVVTDYVDMETAPEDEGLSHCGYLVLRAGEQVRILYVGSEPTGDTGWLYGEVVRSLRPDPAGRRGWLPDRVVQPALAPPPPVPPPPPPGAVASGGSGPRGAPAARGAEPPPPARTAAALECRPLAPARGVPASGASARPPGDAKSRQATAPVPGGGAFPPLPGGEAFPPLPAAPRRGRSQQELASAECKGEPPTLTPEPEPQAKREAAAEAIARQRAAAAKAAAAAGVAKVSPGGQGWCPICTEPYSATGRRRTQRPCCGGELCVQCDHKSLRAKRCYFCREDGDDFPALALACRVSS